MSSGTQSQQRDLRIQVASVAFAVSIVDPRAVARYCIACTFCCVLNLLDPELAVNYLTLAVQIHTQGLENTHSHNTMIATYLLPPSSGQNSASALKREGTGAPPAA